MLLRCVALLLVMASELAFAQADYKVYNDHPRLWLEARRLQRLRKDVERESQRWRNLQRLIKADVIFPEEPLVLALRFQVAGDERAGRQATAWARERGVAGFDDAAELRLAAIVFDWCYDLLTPRERASLAAAMGAGAAALADRGDVSLAAFRSAFLALTSIAGDWEPSPATIHSLMERHWKPRLFPAVDAGDVLGRPADLAALAEIAQVARYNFEIEFWDRPSPFFGALPLVAILQYYPGSVETPEGLFRHAAAPVGRAPDLVREASYGRIAEMIFVAYEHTVGNYPFLQGWLRYDSFTLVSPLGAPYEFLWINPYLPGLSYFSAPLFMHDKLRGRVFARAGWQDDDLWVGYLGGEFQIFADGERHVIRPEDKQAPLVFPGAAVVLARVPMSFKVKVPEGKAIYLVGLEEGQPYRVKVNGSKFIDVRAARGGIIAIENLAEAGWSEIDFDSQVQVRIRLGKK